MSHTAIVYAADPLLTVYIDRMNPGATVYYQYDEGEEQNCAYETADMPMDDQAAAKMVNDWIDG